MVTPGFWGKKSLTVRSAGEKSFYAWFFILGRENTGRGSKQGMMDFLRISSCYTLPALDLLSNSSVGWFKNQFREFGTLMVCDVISFSSWNNSGSVGITSQDLVLLVMIGISFLVLPDFPVISYTPLEYNERSIPL